MRLFGKLELQRTRCAGAHVGATGAHTRQNDCHVKHQPVLEVVVDAVVGSIARKLVGHHAVDDRLKVGKRRRHIVGHARHQLEFVFAAQTRIVALHRLGRIDGARLQQNVARLHDGARTQPLPCTP